MPCFFLRLAASCPPVPLLCHHRGPVYASPRPPRAAGVPKETFHGMKAWQLWGIEGHVTSAAHIPDLRIPSLIGGR